MCQNETPVHRAEESSEALSGVSAELESLPYEALETIAVEAKVSLSEVSGLLDGMHSDQLLAVLGAIGFLIIVATWFLDDVYQRIEFEIHRFKEWWIWKRENARLRSEASVVSTKSELSLASNVHPSDSIASTLEVAASDAAEPIDSLSEQSEFRHQLLADELAQARKFEHQTRSELADAKEQLELFIQAEAKERTSENNLVESLTKSLADHATQIEILQASLSEKSSNADQLAVSLEDSESRCQELTGELAELTSVDEESKSDLAKAKAQIESLTLQTLRFENDLQTSNQEAQALSDELADAREAEHKTRSELADAKEQLKLLAEKEAKERALEVSKVESLKENLG